MPSQNIYHPLPSSGTLTINDIIKEKGHNSGSNYTLKQLALGDNSGGDGIALNRLDNTADQIALIEKTTPYTDLSVYPYSISDWYGYIQPHNITFQNEDQEIESAQLTMYILGRSENYDIETVLLETVYYLDERQRVCFDWTRKNEIGSNPWTSVSETPHTTSTPVSTGEVSVINHTRRTTSTNVQITYTIERTIIRIALADFQRDQMLDSATYTKTLTGITLRLNGLSKTVDDYLAATTNDVTLYVGVFVYTPDGSTISTKTWEPLNNATAAGYFFVEYANGNFNIDLQASLFEQYIFNSNTYLYLNICFLRHDALGKMYFGNNLISSTNSLMSSVGNWSTVIGALNTGHTFTPTFGADGSAFDIKDDSLWGEKPMPGAPWYDNHGSCLRMAYYIYATGGSDSDYQLGIRLNSDYVDGWSDDNVEYTDPNSYTSSRYTILFDYFWDSVIYEFYSFVNLLGVWIKNLYQTGFNINQSVLIANGELIGNQPYVYGIFTTSNQNIVFNSWRTASHTEIFENPSGSGDDDGITIYMLYNNYGALIANAENSAGTHNLYIDNFRIYKSMNRSELTITFQLQSNPLKAVYKCHNNVPTLSCVAASSITQTSFVSGGSGMSHNGSTIRSWGLLWKAGSAPTYASKDGIWEYTVTSKPNTTNALTGFTSGTNSGLTPNTTYYVIAFAKNWASGGTPAGYGFSAAITFKTLGVPSVSTVSDFCDSVFEATLTGFHTNAGNPGSYIDCGFYWIKGSASQATLIASGTRETVADFVGSFSKVITLDGSTSQLYTWIPFAKNSTGEGYGTIDTFVTPTPL